MDDNTTTYQAAAYTGLGTARDKVALPEDLFDGTVNMPVMHQAVKAFLANQRQGNASTKIRKYVVGGNQKPWKQKGTGRARQGSRRAPHFVGGGTVFGPTPRPYDEYVPRQVRALARKSALNARYAENAVMVVDRFDFDAPKTSRIVALVARLGLEDRKVLILTDGAKTNVHLSARNIPTVHVMPYSDVSTYHILWSDAVVIEAPAIGQTLEPVAESAAAPSESATKAAAKQASREKGEAKNARKVTKTAAKKAVKTAAKKSTKAATKSAPKKTAAKKSAPKKKGK
ncbi:MAG: 50S ribosomal protein L4 [Candidatus Eremiobacteraeota bacterium]|nr:50S ribosomal protein L4 [Candidatus Eremiobacteraeota bacterium]